jgi:hypothetical protein
MYISITVESTAEAKVSQFYFFIGNAETEKQRHITGQC